MVQDLLEGFTRYKKDLSLDVSRTNLAFRTVAHDIEEVYLLPNCNCMCHLKLLR